MSKKWTEENLKKLIEENSNCKYLGFVRIKKSNRTRIILKLECKCGETFERDKSVIDTMISNNKEIKCLKCSKKKYG